MSKKTVSAIMMSLLVLGTLAFVFDVQPVWASGTVYIRADGSIDTSTTPIYTADNITYTLTGNITADIDGIVIERDNIVVDGAGYTVMGSGSGNGTTLTDRGNVTLRNMTIKNFDYGIFLDSSSDNNTLSGNNLANNSYGIHLISSSDNVLSGNNVTANNDAGIWLGSSSDNTLSGNNVTANKVYGIWLDSSSNNTISGNNITENNWDGINLVSSSNHNSFSGNNITNNGYGISLSGTPAYSSNNKFYHNNFVNNTLQVYSGSINVWDDGYSTGGNYWSDYNGTDNNQDGIGDAPYVIDATNIDHYPLMGTFQSFNVSVSKLSIRFEEVDIISNSTIREVDFSWADDIHSPTGLVWFLHLTGFVGQNGTVGFCRITFPNDMLNSSSYPIGTIYMGVWNKNLTISKVLSSNGTHTTLYFKYDLPTPDYGLDILAEFPSFLILPLFFIATLLTVIVYKKKGEKTSRS